MAQASQKISYEELERKLAEAEAKLAQTEQCLAQTEQRLIESQEQAKSAQGENYRLRTVIQTVADTLNEIGLSVFLMTPGEPVSETDMLAQWANIRPVITKALNNNKVLKAFFAHGNESLKKPSPDKGLEHKTDNKLKKVLGAKQCLRKALTSMKEVLKDSGASENEALEAAKSIIEHSEQPSEHVQGVDCATVLKGRQVNQADLPKKDFPVQQRQERCECGAQLIGVGEQLEACKNMNLRLADLLTQCETHITIHQCPVCNKVQADIDDDAPVPVLPNQTLSQDTLIEVTELEQNGMPAHRCQSLLLKPMCLGKDTVSRLRLQWDQIYLSPLIHAILSASKGAEILLADETTYDCLQQQGKGISQALEKTGSQNYVFVLSNSPESEHPFVSYHGMRGRSAQCIGEVLTKFKFNPDVLVTDGYAAYPSVIKNQLQSAAHQSCLIHFRREVYQAIDAERLAKEVKGLSDDELKLLLQEKVQKTNPLTLLMVVLIALGEVYRLEGLVKRKEDEELQAYYKRIKDSRKTKVKPLMDGIDKIMKLLASDCVELKGSRYVKKGGAYYSSVCVYYMNQRDSLRYFLNDPRVPCDTNIVERAIRPLTIIRKNNYFTQSVDGMKCLCDCFTLFETARLNGIDAKQWLRDYGRALFKYCYEKGWREQLLEGKDPSKKIMQWDFNRLKEGFDFNAWLPWNYKGR